MAARLLTADSVHSFGLRYGTAMGRVSIGVGLLVSIAACGGKVATGPAVSIGAVIPPPEDVTEAGQSDAGGSVEPCIEAGGRCFLYYLAVGCTGQLSPLSCGDNSASSPHGAFCCLPADAGDSTSAEAGNSIDIGTPACSAVAGGTCVILGIECPGQITPQLTCGDGTYCCMVGAH